MANESIFCAIVKAPLLEKCMTMAEWSATWQSLGIVLTLCLAGGAIYKFFSDRSLARRQEEKNHKLERIKFFLEQHRRLFDDPDLKSVLRYLDGDDEQLAREDHWDHNRKFLVFLEEIELLIRSEMLDPDACQYMFGHYANCALKGENFRKGIQFDEEHWMLFVQFANKYEDFIARTKQSPPMHLTL